MTNPATGKRRGSQFEIDLVKHFREDRGLAAERLHLAGKNDEGDVYVPSLDAIIEAKAPGPNGKIDLSGWTQEAMTERENYAKARGRNYYPTGLVVIKARGKSIDRAYVVLPLFHFMTVYGEQATE